MQDFGKALLDAEGERENYMHITGETEEDEAKHAYDFAGWDF